MDRRAVILAGGKGTRLKPYTTVIPKPLVPVGDRPILEILIERLKLSDITDITLCVNHLAEIIIAFFGDGSKWGVRLTYSVEDKPLSTVAPLKLLNDLPNDFLVMNGDLLTDLDVGKLFEYHVKHNALITVATHKRNLEVDFGVIEVNEAGNMAIGFQEKPEFTLNVSMGIYVFSKKVLDFIPAGKAFGFDSLMYELLKRKQIIHVYPYNGYWLDIGRPEDYEKANEDIKK